MNLEYGYFGGSGGLGMCVVTISETKNEQTIYVGKSLSRDPFRRWRNRGGEITVREIAMTMGDPRNYLTTVPNVVF
jgi:hypothetical protein